MKLLFILCLVVALFGAGESAAEQPGISIPESDRSEKLHGMDREEFAKLPEANEEFDFDHLNHHLLAAAIFHETNRRRVENDLPALTYKHGLREAARIQARGMRKEEMISHQHPDESKKNLSGRLGLLDIKGRYFAENVAMTFGVKYESGEPIYPREKEGERVLSEEAGGPPIPPHTYLSFAKELVDQWMDSPGHRENILAEEAEQLGASALHDRTPGGMDRFYAVQVFFAPFPN